MEEKMNQKNLKKEKLKTLVLHHNILVEVLQLLKKMLFSHLIVTLLLKIILISDPLLLGYPIMLYS